MLIICEDCAKKYNIDESRIRGNRARFTCKACGHIIIVNKSDTTRPLISSGLSPRPSFDDSGTIDLLKEMETSSLPDEQQAESGSVESDSRKQESSTRSNGKAVLFYFIVGFLAAFIGISGALGYLYTSGIVKGASAELVNSAVPVFGAAWAVIFVVFFVLARLVSQPIKKLQKDIARISRGEDDVIIAPQGPKEIRALAVTLAGIRSRIR